MLTLGLLLGATCVRVGFEDNVFLRKGRLAESNAALVAADRRDRAQRRPRARDGRAGARAALAPAGGGRRPMTYRISVDTGGTFTDIVVSDEQGRLELGKAPTTRARAYEGLREGIGQVAERLGLSVGELLGADRGADLRHDGGHQRDPRRHLRADRADLHGRLSRYASGARGRQAGHLYDRHRLSAPLHPASPHLRRARAGEQRGRRRARARRGHLDLLLTEIASREVEAVAVACFGRSSTRRTSGASARCSRPGWPAFPTASP